ncbi:alpha-D-ribose 1-methylphosphonate 5-triphosphate diphosphatase [Pseudoxanthobacter sp.]|uniref:alpha-D-ribose 1-methylphosphonate 5-triphosphate diphosphatase n=1 Tax=Pseudoxanthobacter sp. TaxID=1925742 RepID=UPI002FDFD753
MSPPDLVLANARLVLPERVVHGAVVVRDGFIHAVEEGVTRPAGAIDCAGDYLLPGLVELHTDHLESHYMPRPGVRWDALAAVQAHDLQVAGSGITTVFDALRVGSDPDATDVGRDTQILADAIGRARKDRRLRAEHFLHLRCEVPAATVVAEAGPLFAAGLVRLASLMDHTPGQRQFVDLAQYRRYYQARAGFSDDEMEAYVTYRQKVGAEAGAVNRPQLVAMARAGGAILASHDDATPAHVAEAVAEGVRIAEFPTTTDAAQAARAAGLAILMGAPNVVRGGSHSGNASATQLAEQGLIDILSSDYVPFSLIHAAFLLPERAVGVSLSEAVGFVTRRPALAAGLTDRGSLTPGLRADVVRVHRPPGTLPQVVSVWRQGTRVA